MVAVIQSRKIASLNNSSPVAQTSFLTFATGTTYLLTYTHTSKVDFTAGCFDDTIRYVHAFLGEQGRKHRGSQWYFGFIT